MEFQRGEQVEICSNEEGFRGSYYEATVIKRLTTSSYAVQYKNLLEDDESGPLIEVVSSDEIRPLPPNPSMQSPVSRFVMFDKVDAFHNDGWWVGKIVGKAYSFYYVSFDTTGDAIPYHVSKLRVHQDWVKGKWISSK
ncbi:protein AGENET DOMAIN (AGD)-CONTAINING P1 [Manihot esculenta]